MMAGLRTLVLEVLRILNCKNNVEQLELFQDDFQQLCNFLKYIRFL